MNIFDRMVRLARAEINDFIEKQAKKNPDLAEQQAEEELRRDEEARRGSDGPHRPKDARRDEARAADDHRDRSDEPRDHKASESWRVRVKERFRQEQEAWQRRAEDARKQYERAKQQARAHDPRSELAKHYANLELPLGASKDEVKTSWRKLMRKYHPDMHNTDPEKHRIATELTQRLTESYRFLSKHLEGR
ncbi:MAG: DnaJ domain-containing protein [Myxococcales bacterium]|nr:DnaJ domain-containing protein [Myxococcales bacterium]